MVLIEGHRLPQSASMLSSAHGAGEFSCSLDQFPRQQFGRAWFKEKMLYCPICQCQAFWDKSSFSNQVKDFPSHSLKQVSNVQKDVQIPIKWCKDIMLSNRHPMVVLFPFGWRIGYNLYSVLAIQRKLLSSLE